MLPLSPSMNGVLDHATLLSLPESTTVRKTVITAKSNLPLHDIVHNYFTHLNPIAHRIAGDIEKTKLTYGPLWYTLNISEKHNIINKTLIKPDLELKYFDNFPSITTNNIPSSSENTSLSNDPDDGINTAFIIPRQLIIDKTTSMNSSANKKNMKKKRKVNTKEKQKNKITTGISMDSLEAVVLQNIEIKIITIATVSNDEEHDQWKEHDNSNHDDCVCNNDVHSLIPFSYCTKSQLNLYAATTRFLTWYDETHEQITSTNADRKDNGATKDGDSENDGDGDESAADDEMCLLNNAHCKRSIYNSDFRSGVTLQNSKVHMFKQQQRDHKELKLVKNYRQVQNELKTNLQQQRRNHNYANGKIRTKKAMSTNETIASVAIASTMSTAQSNIISLDRINYAIYTSDSYAYEKNEDCTNLMKNFKRINDSTTVKIISTPSVANANNDHNDGIDKILCEDVNVLDNYDIRHDFDFLKNW